MISSGVYGTDQGSDAVKVICSYHTLTMALTLLMRLRQW